MKVKFTDLGMMEYKKAWDYQQSLNTAVSSGDNGDEADTVLQYLLFVEHPHVYTLGKSGKENNLLINENFLKSMGATFFRTDRGGDITYHGPGQIVGYPIIDLRRLGMGVKQYITTIENIIIAVLNEYGIQGKITDGATGVWIDNVLPGKQGKICAIGVKVSRGVTMHGFALNVNTDLKYFGYINPCGFTDKMVTSMEQLLKHRVEMEDVRKKLVRSFGEYFNLEVI